MVLKTELNIEPRIALLLEPIISYRKLAYSAFNFYWPQLDKVAISVMTIVKKDLLDKILVEHKTELINPSYFVFLEIRDIDQQTKRLGWIIQVLNVYDSRVG